MGNELPMVLVVEDQEMWRTYLGKNAQLKEEIAFKFATTLEEARQVFLESREQWQAIVLNACVQSNFKNPEATAVPFVHWLREEAGYKGPLIATSAGPHFLSEMSLAGCSHWIEHTEVPRVLREVFKLPYAKF